jgi:hypothetical protein
MANKWRIIKIHAGFNKLKCLDEFEHDLDLDYLTIFTESLLVSSQNITHAITLNDTNVETYCSDVKV